MKVLAIFILISFLCIFLYTAITAIFDSRSLELDSYYFTNGINDKKKAEILLEENEGVIYFKEFWGRSFDFTGKTRRKDFWLSSFQGFLIYFVLTLIGYTLLWNEVIAPSVFVGFFWFLIIISFIPTLAIQVRRLHDIGKEPAWVLLSFVPFISLVLIFWYAKPSLRTRTSLSRENEEISINQENTSNKIKGEISGNLKNNFESAEEKLKQITGMFERGIITEEEYKELRKKTLGL